MNDLSGDYTPSPGVPMPDSQAPYAVSKPDPITVTSPLMPPLQEFMPYLEDIWQRQWLTNNGHYHKLLEGALCEYLGVKHISLFSNGTLALMSALQALRISGEVITTPYSFVATTHALWWNHIRPVFADIDPVSLNLEPAKIEAVITPKTTAIMPVHVYGRPCDMEGIGRVADTYGLKVIYDAAHAFGVRQQGMSVLNGGDLSVLSFHATKVFSTIEGGAIVCHDEKMKQRIDYLKNFGFAGETTVVAPGINAKMNEMQAAYGLLSLQHIDRALAHRRQVSDRYRACLSGLPGIGLLDEDATVEHNYAYFPIFVDAQAYGMSRDELYEQLKSHHIMGRRYFYPLISDFPTYRGLPSAAPALLPNARQASDRVICLPMHGHLTLQQVDRVCQVIQKNNSIQP